MVHFFLFEPVVFIENVPMVTGCNLLMCFVLCVSAFWWHFFLKFYIVNKFVEGFLWVFQCRILSTVVEDFPTPSVWASRRYVWNIMLWGSAVNRRCGIGGSTMVEETAYNTNANALSRHWVISVAWGRIPPRTWEAWSYSLIFQFILYKCAFFCIIFNSIIQNIFVL